MISTPGGDSCQYTYEWAKMGLPFQSSNNKENDLIFLKYSFSLFVIWTLWCKADTCTLYRDMYTSLELNFQTINIDWHLLLDYIGLLTNY